MNFDGKLGLLHSLTVRAIGSGDSMHQASVQT
jgi:hypothetical protein